MKLPSGFAVLLAVNYHGASAFAPTTTTPPPSTHRPEVVALSAHPSAHGAWSAAATMAVGWALASQVAMASPLSEPAPTMVDQTMPSTVLAAGAYVPEDSYATLDLSMPSYNTEAVNEIISAPGSKVSGNASGPQTAKTVKPKKGEDPAKALARAQKEADRRAAEEKKRAETLAKMEAKKAERAAIQARRSVVAAESEDA